MSELRMGVYRHYKGQLYQVIGLAHDANDESRTCVVYFGLQLDGAHLGPRLAVRTLGDFTALLHVSDRTVCPYAIHCSHREARFQYLGSELTAEMVS